MLEMAPFAALRVTWTAAAPTDGVDGEPVLPTLAGKVQPAAVFMALATTVSLPKLVLGIGLFVLLGFPLVAYLWESLNQLMGGEVHAGRLLRSVPAALLLAAILLVLARTVRRWEAERLENIRS
jgi:hypothetical protein